LCETLAHFRRFSHPNKPEWNRLFREMAASDLVLSVAKASYCRDQLIEVTTSLFLIATPTKIAFQKLSQLCRIPSDSLSAFYSSLIEDDRDISRLLLTIAKEGRESLQIIQEGAAQNLQNIIQTVCSFAKTRIRGANQMIGP
jgi:hypothetical protein